MTDALEDRDLNAVARHRPSSDHPIWTEPYPRRVRAVLDGVAVVDSTRALLLLEARHLPLYYFPPKDVRTDLLAPTDTTTHCPHKGDASYWSVRVGMRPRDRGLGGWMSRGQCSSPSASGRSRSARQRLHQPGRLHPWDDPISTRGIRAGRNLASSAS